MRTLRVIEFLSLDGVMQAPGAPDEDTEGGFEHGGWMRPYFDDVLGAAAAQGMAATDAYLFGRKTYEKMAAYWPTAQADDPFTEHLNRTPKYVASTTLTEVDWQNSTLLEGDLADAVNALKAKPGKNIGMSGSATLVRSLLDRGLVDELRLLVHPLVVGQGAKLFPDGSSPVSLELVDSKALSTGVLDLTYRPAAA